MKSRLTDKTANNNAAKTALLTSFAAITLALLAPFTAAQSGSAGGAQAQGANPNLEYCAQPLGTLAVHEDQSATWWHTYYRRYPTLGSTVPVLRLMIQQSNCFVVVERGRAMKEVMGERALAESGELRQGSSMQRGQMVAADYTMSPTIQFAEDTGGVGGAVTGALGGLFGSKGRDIARISGGLKKKEAATTLLLIDNRSTVQISAATGQAGKFNFNLGAAGWGNGRYQSAKGYTKTPEGKLIAAAFADSFNQMVKALRQYKTQEIEGGLGTGGKLGVGQ